MLISEFLAKRLKFKLNDKIDVHFPKRDLNKLPNRRSFKIVGIYNSRFQDFDKTIILADIRHIQRMNKWERDTNGNFIEIGNFEVFLDNFDDLDIKGKEVYAQTGSFLDCLIPF